MACLTQKNGFDAHEALEITLQDSVHMGDYTAEEVAAFKNNPDFNRGVYEALGIEMAMRSHQ